MMPSSLSSAFAREEGSDRGQKMTATPMEGSTIVAAWRLAEAMGLDESGEVTL